MFFSTSLHHAAHVGQTSKILKSFSYHDFIHFERSPMQYNLMHQRMVGGKSNILKIVEIKRHARVCPHSLLESAASINPPPAPSNRKWI